MIEIEWKLPKHKLIVQYRCFIFTKFTKRKIRYRQSSKFLSINTILWVPFIVHRQTANPLLLQ